VPPMQALKITLLAAWLSWMGIARISGHDNSLNREGLRWVLYVGDWGRRNSFLP